MSLARVCLSSQKLLAHRNILNICPQLRSVSTTRKNSDVASVERTGEVKKIWVSYGFDTDTDKDDKLHTHLSFFFGISLALMGSIFFIAYAPSDSDWIHREAYLELRRREQEGLPLVDKNYLDVSKIELPSDEELGDTDIII
ncbi:hypothetical protein LSTR_LSTR008927 [Laodelphax striatellus]|uniref:NADH dehydrogenase [ubiquinone] 1 beta subcomplex subunit 11, mitochondrial n=1 Tax=Laodelphax striatellus TaxID=195883 RepID=A0A482WLN9_LAOST|nr:hypothetical protein LSTR_LSTR008927 [Laodelphax striatellus]